jgi:hypothetical protein
LNIDEDPRNADWIKSRSWDLPADFDALLNLALTMHDDDPDAWLERQSHHRAIPPELRSKIAQYLTRERKHDS